MKNEALAIEFFRQNPGIHQTRDILAAGIYNRTLYRLRDRGVLSQVGFGRYRLALEQTGRLSVYAELASRIPKSVFCLISALNFHDIGTQVPYEHWVALPQGSYAPKIEEYDIQYIFSSKHIHELSTVEHRVENQVIRVYTPARTIVDCFKHRSKIGVEVAIEALREAVASKKATVSQIIELAEKCRIKNVIMPYLEATR